MSEFDLDNLNRPNKDSVPLPLKVRMGALALSIYLPMAFGGLSAEATPTGCGDVPPAASVET